jgi:hypothetical protein
LAIARGARLLANHSSALILRIGAGAARPGSRRIETPPAHANGRARTGFLFVRATTDGAGTGIFPKRMMAGAAVQLSSAMRHGSGPQASGRAWQAAV